MRIFLIFSLMWFALFDPAPATAGFKTGNQLLSECEALDDNQKRAVCAGYISGTFDLLLEQQELYPEPILKVCPNERITLGQATDVVVKHLKDNPADRDMSASFLAWMAIYRAWPCLTQKAD